MNAAYRHWRRIDWRPRYYACLDLVVGLSHRDAIGELIEEGRIEKFLLRQNLIDELGEAARRQSVISYDACAALDPLFAEPSVTTGAGAARWGLRLGFSEIVLLGIDARYKEVVDGAVRGRGIELEIQTASDNPNYFFDDYQQPGDRYNLPNPRPDLHVSSFRSAGRDLLAEGARVLNANPQSAVSFFPFVDLDDLLSEGAAPMPPRESLAPKTAGENTAHRAPPTKLAAFLRHSGALLAVVAIVPVVALVAIGAFGPPAASTIVVLAALAFACLAAGLLYLRFAVTQRLSQLQVENDRLRALIADFERRLGR